MNRLRRIAAAIGLLLAVTSSSGCAYRFVGRPFTSMEDVKPGEAVIVGRLHAKLFGNLVPEWGRGTSASIKLERPLGDVTEIAYVYVPRDGVFAHVIPAGHWKIETSIYTSNTNYKLRDPDITLHSLSLGPGKTGDSYQVMANWYNWGPADLPDAPLNKGCTQLDAEAGKMYWLGDRTVEFAPSVAVGAPLNAQQVPQLTLTWKTRPFYDDEARFRRTLEATYMVDMSLPLLKPTDAPPPAPPAVAAKPAAAPSTPSAPALAAKSAAPSTAPVGTTTPADDWVVIQGFEQVQAGMRCVYSVPALGGTSEWVVVSKSDTSYQVKVTIVKDGKAVGEPSTKTIEGRVRRADLPKILGKESVEAAGRKWDCEIIEISGAKVWHANEFPFMVCSEKDGKILLSLVEVK